MKGANKVKKFGSRMKTYAQVLDLKENQNEKNKQTIKRREDRSKNETNKINDKTDISKLEDTINVLKQQIEGLLK